MRCTIRGTLTKKGYFGRERRSRRGQGEKRIRGPGMGEQG